MINKIYAIPSGATPIFHVVRNLELSFVTDSVMINVGSYASQEAYNTGAPLMWNTPIQIPSSIIGPPILLAVETWLVEDESSPLFGGEIIGDTSQTLETIKDKKWAEIKAVRAHKEYGGFSHNGDSYDSDQESARRIVGATTLASLAKAANEEFSIDWTLADNSVKTLDADAMINVGAALGAYVSQLYSISRTLRVEIENATTVEEVALIHWPV